MPILFCVVACSFEKFRFRKLNSLHVCSILDTRNKILSRVLYWIFAKTGLRIFKFARFFVPREVHWADGLILLYFIRSIPLFSHTLLWMHANCMFAIYWKAFTTTTRRPTIMYHTTERAKPRPEHPKLTAGLQQVTIETCFNATIVDAFSISSVKRQPVKVWSTHILLQNVGNNARNIHSWTWDFISRYVSE